MQRKLGWGILRQAELHLLTADLACEHAAASAAKRDIFDSRRQRKSEPIHECLTALHVDVVDANHPVIKADTQVEVAYGITEPRTVRLLGAQRSHFWKNPLGWFGDQLTALAIIVLVIVGFGWLGNRGQKWLAGRIDRALPR